MLKKGIAARRSGMFLPLAALLSLAFAALVLLGVFAAAAGVICRTDVDPALLAPIVTAALGFAAFGGGLALAFVCGGRGMLLGFCEGIALYLLLLAAALLCRQREFAGTAFLRLIVLCAAGALGGSLGAALAQRRRRPR